MSDPNELFDEIFGATPYSDTVKSKEEILSSDYIAGETEYGYLHRTGHFDMAREQLKDAPRQAKPKKKNRGKVFETLVKSSAEKQYIDCERLKDAGYKGEEEEGKRFTITNLADFVLFNGKRQLWLEVKTTGTSFIFEFRQRRDMTRKSGKKQSQPLRTSGKQMIGLLIEFKRDGTPFEVWYVDIDDLNAMDKMISKKSFNTKDLHKFYVEAETCNSYPVRMYRPARARKDYIDIEGMMRGNAIDSSTVQLESV